MVIKAPNKINPPQNYIKIFLGGSITSGNDDGNMSVDWQTKFITEFESVKRVAFINPRRDTWDNSWVQSYDNPQFYQQVNWELKALESSDIIVMYLDPATKAPISLMELGLHAKSKKLIVCCPDGFFRKGNVDIVCQYYNIPLVDNLDELVKYTKDVLYNNYGKK